MTTFGTFAPSDQLTADNQPGRLPPDQGMGDKASSLMAAQAWAVSPANYIKPVGTSELPSSGYGAGPRARLDDAILKNYESSQPSTTWPVDRLAAAAPAEVKSLRSILPAVGISQRQADITTQSKPADLIDALSSRPSFDVRNPTFFPGSPFAPPASGPRDYAAPSSLSALARTETGPLPQARDYAAPAGASALARTETGPLPQARVETTARPAAPAFDVKNHPLFANINKEAKTSPYNYNARMDSPASIEALSRQIMSIDFGAPKGWASDKSAAKVADPFLTTANCYQTIAIGHDGSCKTITTLPDLSASKVEVAFSDKSKNVGLTDHLGRSTVDQRFDSTGQLVSHTSTSYDHADAPMAASKKTVQTATQTIETRMNAQGTVVASKIMPYSDLNANKSIA